MPKGKVMTTLTDKLLTDGGQIVAMNEADLRCFVALQNMQAAEIAGFETWLRARTPLCDTGFFRAVGLCPPPVSPTTPREPTHIVVPRESEITRQVAEPKSNSTSHQNGSAGHEAFTAPTPITDTSTIPLGRRLEGGTEGREEELAVSLLTRHTAIFAGSGSGKTVLLRRIVEEAALLGIPAIVLDTNNDLARLGEPWPNRPSAFSEGDALKARRYRENVEVIVWTPGLPGGRPLTLAILPDFSIASEGEERDQAVDMAWATLVPLVGATGASKVLKEGVLKEALASFACHGSGGTERFIEFLADLPSDVSKQSKAEKHAADMADHLRGKIAVNPLLNARGQPLDPALLYKASRPGVTRISVINFSGLHADESRQDFVNQLQMALFTFIRKHPSKTPRLYVLDEAQNFAPSQVMTPSKASAMALAAQARKFGMGMIFATQAPKGIDTKIVSNCTTHFYGRMSSPALIDATSEMMAARGKAAGDLGRLSAGNFYYSTEGMSVPVKIKMPLCLSYHPQNPATPEEMLALAKQRS
jgi:hypothetical protein